MRKFLIYCLYFFLFVACMILFSLPYAIRKVNKDDELSEKTRIMITDLCESVVEKNDFIKEMYNCPPYIYDEHTLCKAISDCAIERLPKYFVDSKEREEFESIYSYSSSEVKARERVLKDVEIVFSECFEYIKIFCPVKKYY